MSKFKSSQHELKKKNLQPKEEIKLNDKIGIIGLILAMLAIIVPIANQEIRNGLGLEKTPIVSITITPTEPTLVEDTVTPSVTEKNRSTLIQETPQELKTVELLTPTSTCKDYIDIRFFERPFSSTGKITTTTHINEVPNGIFLVLGIEYTSVQNQPVSLGWSNSLKIAGQIDGKWVYFSPDSDVTYYYGWDKFDSNSINCPYEINPGLWYKCYMVFDINPEITNRYLVLKDDFGFFEDSCKTNWKLPD